MSNTSKTSKSLGLMAALVALLSSASPGMAATAPVDLGSADNFAILSKSGITDVPTSVIVGDIGSSPINGAAIGVPCTEVVGIIYSVDATGPACEVINPTLLGLAVLDMGTAYTDAAGRAPTGPAYIDVGAGEIGGLTLAPGVYQWSSAVTISTDVTLKGGPNDVWILQIAGTLDIDSGIQVILTGGARAANVFWQVADVTTLGTSSTFNGTILDKTLIALQTGATLEGRALAQTAVTLEMNAITIPAFVPAKGAKSIKVGPIRVTGAPDYGSCNNVWATDAFEMVYTITANGYGTYNVNVKYNKGTFVTIGGVSPGACEPVANHGNYLNTVAGGIKGTMVQEYNGTVTGTLIPGVKYTGGFVTDTKTTTTSILNTLFGSGAWSWTILPDGGHWTWNNVYKAGKHGTYTDTSTNWPLNNKGDIN